MCSSTFQKRNSNDKIIVCQKERLLITMRLLVILILLFCVFANSRSYTVFALNNDSPYSRQDSALFVSSKFIEIKTPFEKSVMDRIFYGKTPILIDTLSKFIEKKEYGRLLADGKNVSRLFYIDSVFLVYDIGDSCEQKDGLCSDYENFVGIDGSLVYVQTRDFIKRSDHPYDCHAFLKKLSAQYFLVKSDFYYKKFYNEDSLITNNKMKVHRNFSCRGWVGFPLNEFEKDEIDFLKKDEITP